MRRRSPHEYLYRGAPIYIRVVIVCSGLTLTSVLRPAGILHIELKYRSSLRVIHLLIAATAPVVGKHGLALITKPLIKVLATEGVTINIHGSEKTFQGALLLCLGDNLGSNAMEGFKQSFSFSFRFCRSCYVTNSEYKTYSDSSDLVLRCNEKHERECSLLTGPLYDHYSKTYGINKRSALILFHVFWWFTSRHYA